MREYEVVFDYVKVIVLADSIEDARIEAQEQMGEIALFANIDRVDEY